MADEKKSIFDLADKFGYASPFDDWLEESENINFPQPRINSVKIQKLFSLRNNDFTWNTMDKYVLSMSIMGNPYKVTVEYGGLEKKAGLNNDPYYSGNYILQLSAFPELISQPKKFEKKDFFFNVKVFPVTDQLRRLLVQPPVLNSSLNIDLKPSDSKTVMVDLLLDGSANISNKRKTNDISSNKIDKLSEEQISSISSFLKKENVKKHIEGINDAIEDNNINTCLRASNFLAQILHESGGLRLTKEGGVSESDYGGFIGRGLIQITGESNYKKYQDFSGEDVTSNLENKKKLENSPHAGKSAGWFWDVSNLNPLADKNDFIMITRTINGGFNGYDGRLKYLKGALKSICKKETEILGFSSSKAYNDKRASFAWGLWHDPGINKNGCTKDKNKAIEGYQRFLDIIPKDYKQYNWYGIKSIQAFQSIKETNSSVDVKKAAELRLKELKK